MTEDQDHTAIGSRFAAAIASKDLAALGELLAEDATIWHNTDGKAQTREEALAGIGAFFSATDECRYEAVRRLPTPAGFVQQHDLRVRFRGAQTLLAVPVCLVVTLKDGRISRLDEYLDVSAFSAPVTKEP